jgi:hypothetical protein
MQLLRRFERRAVRPSFKAGSSPGGAGSALKKCWKYESQEEEVSSAGRSGNGELWFFRDDCR